MRRRILFHKSKQGFKPYYSDFPTFTEYGTYDLTPQEDDTKNSNVYIKLDGTSYNYCGGAALNEKLRIIYTEDSFSVYKRIAYIESMMNKWITKNQTSKIAKFKRCDGTENDKAKMVFYIEKVD